MTLAEAVRNLRKARRMTQQELADAINRATGERVTQGTITNVETGRHENPSERMLQLLAAGLEMTAADLRLAAGMDAPPPDTAGIPPEVLASLQQLAPGMSQDAWHLLIEIARQTAQRDAERRVQRVQGAEVPTHDEKPAHKSRRRGFRLGAL